MIDVLKQILLGRIVNKARQQVNNKDTRYQPHYLMLMQRKELWSNGHYVVLAELMDWSLASTKRLFGLPGHQSQKSFSAHSEKRICEFLGFKNWEDLQQSLVNELIKTPGPDRARQLKSLASALNDLEIQIDLLKSSYETLYSKFDSLIKDNSKVVISNSKCEQAFP